MAGVAKCLFRRQPNQGIIASVLHRDPLPLVSTAILQHSEVNNPNSIVAFPDSSCLSGAELIKKDAFEIYPSFSFGYFLNPHSPYGLCQPQPSVVQNSESDDSGMMWADSVKKKRKRKMNKHKLRKLRKRLRGRS